MKIQILSNQQTQKVSAKGKPYNVLELSFKNLGTGKIEGKNLMPFGETQGTFNTLATANSGDVYEITVVKNAASGYWDWTAAERSTADAPAATAPGVPVRASGSATASPKSTYETPEERAAKQVYIVRQSSISSAVSILAHGSKSALDVDQVLATASRLEDYVFGKDKQVEAEPAATLSDMDDDIPF